MSSIRWPYSTRDQLRAWSARHGRPYNDLIRDALERVAADPARALRDAHGHALLVTEPAAHVPIQAQDRPLWETAKTALEEHLGAPQPLGRVVRALVERALTDDPPVTGAPFTREAVQWAELTITEAQYDRYEEPQWALLDSNETVIGTLPVPQARPLSLGMTVLGACGYLLDTHGLHATGEGCDWRGPRPTITTIRPGTVVQTRRYRATAIEEG